MTPRPCHVEARLKRISTLSRTARNRCWAVKQSAHCQSKKPYGAHPRSLDPPSSGFVQSWVEAHTFYACFTWEGCYVNTKHVSACSYNSAQSECGSRLVRTGATSRDNRTRCLAFPTKWQVRSMKHTVCGQSQRASWCHSSFTGCAKERLVEC